MCVPFLKILFFYWSVAILLRVCSIVNRPSPSSLRLFQSRLIISPAPQSCTTTIQAIVYHQEVHCGPGSQVASLSTDNFSSYFFGSPNSKRQYNFFLKDMKCSGRKVLVNVLHSKWCAKIDSKAQGKIIITVENWHLRNAKWKILLPCTSMYHLTRKEKEGGFYLKNILERENGGFLVKKKGSQKMWFLRVSRGKAVVLPK